jgi:hypothetical protein
MSKNIGSFLAFNKGWFQKNQRSLLFLANAPVLKLWFRWVLRIRRFDCSLDKQIIQLLPNSYTVLNSLAGDKANVTSDFRTHPKFGKRIYYAFRPVWWLLHFWDWALADRYMPQWSYGFSTLTAFPSAGDPGTTTVDGILDANSFASYALTHAATSGDSASSSSSDLRIHNSVSGGGTSWRIDRSIAGFNTSSLTSVATISAATVSILAGSRSNADSDSLSVVGASPASNTTLIADDFDQVGSAVTNPTKLATDITLASIDISGSVYTDFALNASGLSYISKTGVTNLGFRSAKDCSNTAPSIGLNQLDFNSADNAGTSTDPKLVVTYSISSNRFLSLLGAGS